MSIPPYINLSTYSAADDSLVLQAKSNHLKENSVAASNLAKKAKDTDSLANLQGKQTPRTVTVRAMKQAEVQSARDLELSALSATASAILLSFLNPKISG